MLAYINKLESEKSNEARKQHEIALKKKIAENLSTLKSMMKSEIELENYRDVLGIISEDLKGLEEICQDERFVKLKECFLKRVGNLKNWDEAIAEMEAEMESGGYLKVLMLLEEFKNLKIV